MNANAGRGSPSAVYRISQTTKRRVASPTVSQAISAKHTQPYPPPPGIRVYGCRCRARSIRPARGARSGWHLEAQPRSRRNTLQPSPPPDPAGAATLSLPPSPAGFPDTMCETCAASALHRARGRRPAWWPTTAASGLLVRCRGHHGTLLTRHNAWRVRPEAPLDPYTPQRQPGDLMREDEPRDLVQRSRRLVRALGAVRDSGLPDAWIGASAIRDLVWSERHVNGSAPTSMRNLDAVLLHVAELRRDYEHRATGGWLAAWPEPTGVGCWSRWPGHHWPPRPRRRSPEAGGWRDPTWSLPQTASVTKAYRRQRRGCRPLGAPQGRSV